jgi:hypothetical protein
MGKYDAERFRQMIARAFSVLFLMLTVAGSALAAPDAAKSVPAKPEMTYLDNGQIRIGFDLSMGGAITYLSKSGSDANIVNSDDLGREIQMSFYSGPVPYVPTGATVSANWKGLGWNPIQCGDFYGHRSQVTQSRNDGKTITLTCIPMQWPLDNVPGKCVFESKITLDGDAALVTGRLINNRDDKTEYPARGQELPAVYTNGPWDKIITYTGDQPYTGDAVRTLPSQFPWQGVEATENWVALVNDAGTGVGVWEPDVYHFSTGFFGTPGAGGPSDSPTGYIAPNDTEILDHNIDYSFHYDLIVGNVDAIRKYVYAHAEKPSPPQYRFDRDRQHWIYANATDTGWPIRGALHVNLDGKDPQMIGPPAFWQAADAPTLRIDAAFHTTSSMAQVFWSRADSPGFSQEKSLQFPIQPDGREHVYVVPLASSPEYHGAITGLRLDPEDTGHAGDTVTVKSIGFLKP